MEIYTSLAYGQTIKTSFQKCYVTNTVHIYTVFLSFWLPLNMHSKHRVLPETSSWESWQQIPHRYEKSGKGQVNFLLRKCREILELKLPRITIAVCDDVCSILCIVMYSSIEGLLPNKRKDKRIGIRHSVEISERIHEGQLQLQQITYTSQEIVLHKHHPTTLLF